MANNKLQPHRVICLSIIAVWNFPRFSDRSFVSRPGARIGWLGGGGGGGGGGRNKFWGGTSSLFCVNSRGAREIYPSLDKLNKVRSKDSNGFSGPNRKFKHFFRPKTGDLQKKGLHLKNVMKMSPIWASISTPVAPTLFISSGHSPRLGRHSFCLGGGGTSSHLGRHGLGIPPVAPGLFVSAYEPILSWN